MQRVPNGAKLLHEAGLIYKINREILHPLGLALGYEKDEHEVTLPGLFVFDCGEPLEYEPDPKRDAEREAWFAAFKRSRGL